MCLRVCASWVCSSTSISQCFYEWPNTIQYVCSLCITSCFPTEIRIDFWITSNRPMVLLNTVSRAVVWGDGDGYPITLQLSLFISPLSLTYLSTEYDNAPVTTQFTSVMNNCNYFNILNFYLVSMIHISSPNQLVFC